MPRATISQYFPFILLIRLFLHSADLKRVERSRSAELADFQCQSQFFNMKNLLFESHESSQTFKAITQ